MCRSIRCSIGGGCGGVTGWLIALVVGIFLVVGASYSVATRTNPLSDFAVRFRDTAMIWFERNVLLWNTIWPRNAYVEVLDFPAVRRSARRPRLRCDAACSPGRQVAHRRSHGRRRLAGHDLAGFGTAGGPSRSNRRSDSRGHFRRRAGSTRCKANSIDRIRLSKPDDRQALVELFQQLSERAAEPGMGRRLRMLDVPSRVEVVTWGDKTSNETPLPLGGDQEYSGTISDLKESVKFRIRAGDYSTPVRSITLVPPPMLWRCHRNEWRPAYIYQRPPIDGGLAGLRGLRQAFVDQAVFAERPRIANQRARRHRHRVARRRWTRI